MTLLQTPRFQNLQDWLTWQESLHFSAIDLGLDRVREVAGRLDLLTPAFPIITVAGTNGKGSTVALLNALLHEAGYRTGAYTSPHILKYNERITLSQKMASDALICEAFAAIDAVRGNVSLTYFEFGTLAALWIFREARVEIALLEVGLGGRLDAANLWDADVAIVTGIGVDHVAWLGDNREGIGREKAGIARAGKPLVCGDPEPPESIAETARAIGAELYQINRDFIVQNNPGAQCFKVHFNPVSVAQSINKQAPRHWDNLPYPALLGEVQLNNAACALVALHTLDTLGERFVVEQAALHRALQSVSLPGRLQRLQTAPEVLVDVAHNAHAAVQLALWLKKNPPAGRTYVLFSVLSDKDVRAVVEPLRDVVDEWHFFPLQDERAMPEAEIRIAFDFCSIQSAVSHEGLKPAWNALRARLNAHDRVVAFGSFLVVSSMLEEFV